MTEKLDDWEIELIGEARNFAPVIDEVASELNIPDYAIEARLENQDEINFLYYNIFSINRRNASRMLIGVLTLKSIGAERTILKVPPRSQWKQRILGDNSVRVGLVLSNEDPQYRAFYDEQFSKYMKALLRNLKRYGLTLTWSKRLWRSFEKLIGIYKAIKP